MFILGVILDIIIGGIAGWLAGNIMGTPAPDSLIFINIANWITDKITPIKSQTIANVVLGVLGGFVGGIIFGILGLHSSNIVGGFVISVVGACLLIFLYNKLNK